MKSPIFDLFARSGSAVTPSEKSSVNVNTNRKSTTRFPMSPRWTSYVVPKPPKGGSKTQNGRFPSKIALCLKKVCYKVSLCENCLRQSFVGHSLTVRQWLVGTRYCNLQSRDSRIPGLSRTQFRDFGINKIYLFNGLSRSRSLYVAVRPSVCLSVCRLYRSCTLLRRLKFSAMFYAIWYAGHLLTLR